ncbi:hypothetical protein A2U01_0051135, partial [Trifolium medium]|nr:hypothetical protein [Trifolium medium]
MDNGMSPSFTTFAVRKTITSQ